MSHGVWWRWVNLGEFSPLALALASVKGMGKVAAERSIIEKISREWNVIAGGLSSDVSIAYLRGAVLFLETDNPMWQMEFGFLKTLLLSRIQALVGTKTIQDVRLSLAEAPVSADESKTAAMSVPLEVAIVQENKNRLAMGMALCDACGDVFTKDGICVFCRCQV